MEPSTTENYSGNAKVTLFPRYETGRKLQEIIAIIGWIAVIIGAILLLYGISKISEGDRGFGGGFGPVQGMLSIFSGLTNVILGLLTVAAAQAARAVMDSADYARQSLLLQVEMMDAKPAAPVRTVARNIPPEPSVSPEPVAPANKIRSKPQNIVEPTKAKRNPRGGR